MHLRRLVDFAHAILAPINLVNILKAVKNLNGENYSSDIENLEFITHAKYQSDIDFTVDADFAPLITELNVNIAIALDKAENTEDNLSINLFSAAFEQELGYLENAPDYASVVESLNFLKANFAKQMYGPDAEPTFYDLLKTVDLNAFAIALANLEIFVSKNEIINTTTSTVKTETKSTEQPAQKTEKKRILN